MGQPRQPHIKEVNKAADGDRRDQGACAEESINYELQKLIENGISFSMSIQKRGCIGIIKTIDKPALIVGNN